MELPNRKHPRLSHCNYYVIWSEKEGLRYLNYMDENPIRWAMDEYYEE